MKTKDKFWIWGQEAGCHDTYTGRHSTTTPVEGAQFLGIDNMIVVRYGGKPEPPFVDYGREMSHYKQLVWSIIGDASTGASVDLDSFVELAGTRPNLVGGIMDDFCPRTTGENPLLVPQDIADMKRSMIVGGRELDLWVVLYAHELIDGERLKPYIDNCDIINFWTWRAEELAALDENFSTLERLYPGKRKILGCYMFDYGDCKEMPVELMETQCESGLRWLKEGRIEGMVFLASCICDLNLPAVEWSRKFIASVGEDEL